MLEQAIVDASALKEAAMKNAESIIIDKYSEDVKKVIETLLEQDEELEELGDEEPMELPGEELEDEPTDDIVDDVPPAHPVGDEGEGEVDALRDAVDAAEEAIGDVNDKLDALENVAAAGDDSDVEIDLRQLRADLEGEEGLEADDMIDREELAAELEEEPPMQEEFDIDDDLLSAIVQELRVDLDPTAGGWLNRPDSDLKQAAEQELAAAQDDAVAEENDELRKAMKSVQLENKNLQTQSSTTQEKNKKLEQTILHLKGKFDEINLSNARLLYTNKVLSSASLNERQKNKIVEAISKADTIEEAKVIYETLESAAGTFQKEDMPKSLSEAVQRGSSMLVSRNRKREESVSDSFSERMQKLAGIK
jgi:hypothetical protein